MFLGMNKGGIIIGSKEFSITIMKESLKETLQQSKLIRKETLKDSGSKTHRGDEEKSEREKMPNEMHLENLKRFKSSKVLSRRLALQTVEEEL